MSTIERDVATRTRDTSTARGKVVEMNWDPITRIVGSLGIYTKIDFDKRQVVQCHSTSSIFRGYSVFMKGKDPRDSHFITSRICGICGDNHCVCSVYTQNMAYGIRPPAIAEWIINLGEAAEYMFDHNIFQDNLLMVDFCAKMVQETNPGVWEQAKRTAAPNADKHGYRTIADIMTSLNPFEGDFYRETLQVSRYTREMIILMEGRHVHPSTIYPGGVGTVPTVQLFTDYHVRLMRYCEFMKRCLPMHEDIFAFFYDALPGYEEVGRRRILLGCWGSFQDPDKCDYQYKTMNEWGKAMFVTPGVVVDGKLLTTNLVDININMRILLGSSYYDDWQERDKFVDKDPLGNPIDIRHPWNQTTVPRPQKRNFGGHYSWVMSPRWLDKRDGAHLALDTGGGALARLWSTALAGLVDIGYIKSTGHSVKMYLPRTSLKPEVEFEWHVPKFSNAIERDRARTYFQVYAACAALHFIEKALAELQAGRTQTFTPFKVPEEAIGCGFHEAVRGVLSSFARARSPTTIPTRPRPGMPIRATVSALRGRMRMPCRTHPFSRRTGLTNSKVSISCARCAVSTPACPAACTCISVTGGPCARRMHRPTVASVPTNRQRSRMHEHGERSLRRHTRAFTGATGSP